MFKILSSCFWFHLEVIKINPGSIFAIYSKEIHSEGLWYRVKVLKVKGDKVQIEYMDYGDTGMVPSSSLKNIPPRFLELPFQVCGDPSFFPVLCKSVSIVLIRNDCCSSTNCHVHTVVATFSLGLLPSWCRRRRMRHNRPPPHNLFFLLSSLLLYPFVPCLHHHVLHQLCLLHQVGEQPEEEGIFFMLRPRGYGF